MGVSHSGCFRCCAGVSEVAPLREVKVVVFGLDNSGKSTLLANLNGEPSEDVSPTIGFSSTRLNIDNCEVTFYDVGGGPRIRGIWKNYYYEACGIMFVVDSSSPERFLEAKNVLKEVVQDEKIAGKPLLIFANKQDQDGASGDSEIAIQLGLDELLGESRPHSAVVKCIALKSASRNRTDPSLRQGLGWLLQSILDQYSDLSSRVKIDVTAQREREAIERRERMERVRKIREERERQKASSEDDTVNGGEQSMVNPFKPISQVVEEAERREQRKKVTGDRKGSIIDQTTGPASAAQNTTNESTSVIDPRSYGSVVVSSGAGVTDLKRSSQSSINQLSSDLSASEDTLTDVTPHTQGSSDSLRLSASFNPPLLANHHNSSSAGQQNLNKTEESLELLQSTKSTKEKKNRNQFLSRLKNRNKTAPAPFSSPNDDGESHHPPISRNTWTGLDIEAVLPPLINPSNTIKGVQEDTFHGLPHLPQSKRLLPPIKFHREPVGATKKTFHIPEDIAVVPQEEIVLVSHPPPPPMVSSIATSST